MSYISLSGSGGGSGGLTVGTTTISGGTPGDLLYDNSGVLGEESISAALDVIGAAQGDILYRSATGWAVLVPGTSGYFLETQGAGANPIWAAGGGGGGGLTVGSTTISGGTGDILYDNSGVLGEANLTSIIDFYLGSTQGDIIYRNATQWTVLAPGTSGYFLETQGAGANPQWAAGGGGGGLTIGSTTISGSTADDVLYGDGSVLQQASAFQITSGQPNVASSHSYLYAGDQAIYAQINGANSNWFFADSGPGGFSATGLGNYGMGYGALGSLTSSVFNIAIGPNALAVCDTTPGRNVAIGRDALAQMTGGGGSNMVAIGDLAMADFVGSNDSGNVAIGSGAMSTATGGSNNVGIGHGALGAVTTGGNNMAVGLNALSASLTGSSNMAVGSGALATMTVGSSNVGIGSNALTALISASNNTALGESALSQSQNDSDNIAIGFRALFFLNGGSNNVALGSSAGSGAGGGLTTGVNNVFIGYQSGDDVSSDSNNVFIGYQSGFQVSGGSNNCFVGYEAGRSYTGTESYNTVLGSILGIAGQSNTIMIGDGQHNLRADYNSTIAAEWLFVGTLNLGAAAVAATVAASFLADHRLTVTFNGVTYYLPCSTTAW